MEREKYETNMTNNIQIQRQISLRFGCALQSVTELSDESSGEKKVFWDNSLTVLDVVELLIAERWVKRKSGAYQTGATPRSYCDLNDDTQRAVALVKHRYGLARKWKLMCENDIH